MQWNESGTKVASSSERSSARWPLTEQLPLGGGGEPPGRPGRVRLRKVGPRWARPSWGVGGPVEPVVTWD